MTAPTIEEQIALIKVFVESCDENNIDAPRFNAILASLEKLAALEKPVPVEPDAVATFRKTYHAAYPMKGVVDYIDSLQSALQRAQEERDDNGKEWARSAEALVITIQRAEKAESLNRRMVELLKEPAAVGVVYADKNPPEGHHGRVFSWLISPKDISDDTKLYAMSAELLKECGE